MLHECKPGYWTVEATRQFLPLTLLCVFDRLIDADINSQSSVGMISYTMSYLTLALGYRLYYITVFMIFSDTKLILLSFYVCNMCNIAYVHSLHNFCLIIFSSS